MNIHGLVCTLNSTMAVANKYKKLTRQRESIKKTDPLIQHRIYMQSTYDTTDIYIYHQRFSFLVKIK